MLENNNGPSEPIADKKALMNNILLMHNGDGWKIGLLGTTRLKGFPLTPRTVANHIPTDLDCTLTNKKKEDSR